MSIVKPGDWVIKKGPKTDYTTGRTGRVLQLDKMGEKAQVQWIHCIKYGEINIRTWVTIEGSRGIEKWGRQPSEGDLSLGAH